MLKPVSSSLPQNDISDASDHSAFGDSSLHFHGGGTKRAEHPEPNAIARPGRNFATQDYLALGFHPAIRAAALAALSQHRFAPPGSAPHLGLTAPVIALEASIAKFLQLPAAAIFSSGTEAIRTTLHTVLRPGDDVIVDAGAHPAMFETVLTARAQLHRSPAGSFEAIERRLLRLLRRPRTGRIFVAVPAISAHASGMADLAGLSALARSCGAQLIADVTHDLGAMGQGGGGVMEIQGCMGRIDIVIGSFAKSFGAAGGFTALRDPAQKDALHQGQWRTAAPSPVNASVILAALDIIEAPEGRRRRRQLHGSALRLRNHLMADGVRVMGSASPLVLVRLPALTARHRTELLESAGPLVTLLQAPAVAAHAPRWRFQLNAGHGAADIDDLAELVRDVTRTFDRQPRYAQQIEAAAQT
jgi:glycine C-acetyltransferase